MPLTMTQANPTVDGIQLIVEGAAGHTVVMLHGWPDTRRLWDDTVQALQGRYQCVRFTMPGFDSRLPPRATSLADMTVMLRRIVRSVSPGKPVTLLMHDWGCVFGYEFAARHPDLVARIVAVDIGDHNSDVLIRSRSLKAKLQVLVYQAWLALAWKFGGSLGTGMTRWMARQMRCTSSQSRITWQMNYPYAMQWMGLLGGFRAALPVEPHCPTLYIYGQRKPFMFQSARWLDKLAARPGCKVQAFATGHWVMVQQPQEFKQAVLEWLRSVPLQN